MFIGNTLRTLVDFHKNEQNMLVQERENISYFCTQVFAIISLIMTIVFGVLVFFALPFFSVKYLVIYLISFAVFTVLTFLFRRAHVAKSEHFLPLVYFFVLYLYAFGIFVSISATPDSHAAVSVICLQVIFPLLIFDRSYRINMLSLSMYVIHSVLAYFFKNYSDFVLDTFNGGAFTVVGMIIGLYERYVRLANFEKDRILEHQKSTDMLTDLPNRRMLFERLTGIQENNGSLAGLFMIDIDHFKIFNDTLGHQQGDQCLRLLGKCFADFGAENGFEFYRYGGEEFCALTTKDTYDELRAHAEKLRRTVESLAIPFAQNEAGVVTISIGFAPHYYTQNYEVTIKQADDALYNAKRTGRNCIFGSK
ncbi:MAG: diguanylate cyclase [Treponema sp.]|nr:diguanylate cyclase [Treponema sp.]